MNIAGIDPSLTNTGLAILTNGHPTHLSHHGYPGHNSDTWKTRSRRIRWTTRTTYQTLTTGRHIDLAVIEGPAYNSHHGSAFDRAALWHGIYAALEAAHIPIAVVAPRTRAAWATGTGTATKTDVTNAVQTWYPNTTITCDDEADALVLAAIGAHHHHQPLPFPTKPRHTTALDKIHWPEETE